MKIKELSVKFYREWFNFIFLWFIFICIQW